MTDIPLRSGPSGPLYTGNSGVTPVEINGGATPEIDFANNRYYILTLDQNATLEMTIPGAGVECFLEVIQPSAGGPFTLTYPATVDWTDGDPPVLSTGANDIDLLRFLSNGTRLRGWAQGMNLAP